MRIAGIEAGGSKEQLVREKVRTSGANVWQVKES
jgi:hypothetical protein